jgi:hypothetical protein
MNIEIPLNEKSKKIIEETFSQYKESTKLPKVLSGRTVIHMYPQKDTIESNGDLIGFEDSLLFNFNIYDTTHKRVYKRMGLFDEFVMEVPCRIRSFKDLSTMIVIDKNISIGGSQSILIYPAD